MLSSLWRTRILIATLLVLWIIGLAAGAIHPVGFVVSLLVAAAWTWFMLAFGVSISIPARNSNENTGANLGLILLTTGTTVLPFVLPRALNSIALGACSPPFVIWLSLVSYRDVRNAFKYAAYPGIEWMSIDTGEGALMVVATAALSAIIPLIGGVCLWRRSLSKFDRLIGRPWRSSFPIDDVQSEPHRDRLDGVT